MKNNEMPADYLDVIYKGRNKAYGSYELRRHYPARMKLAMISIMAFVGILLLIPLLGFDKQSDQLPVMRRRPDILADLSPTPTIPPKPELPVHPPQPKTDAATQRYTKPEIVADLLAKDPMPPTDSLIGKEISDVTKSGSVTTGNSAASSSGNNTGNSSGDATASRTNTFPIRVAEKMPSPPYSVADFLSKNLRYPEAAREMGQEGKVVVEFIVGEDGRIVSPKILRSAGKALDAEALRVLSLMPAWQPGMQGGQAVKVYFVLPITFNLD